MNTNSPSNRGCVIPKNQTIYGSKYYIEKLSKLSIFENDPKNYLPAIINTVLFSALVNTSRSKNPFRESLIGVLSGLSIQLYNTPGTFAEFRISDSSYIFDNSLISLPSQTLYLNKQKYQKEYSAVLLSLNTTGIKLWWYDNSTNTPIGILNPSDIWTSKEFLLKAYRVYFNHITESVLFENFYTPTEFIINSQPYFTHSIPYLYSQYCINSCSNILNMLYPYYSYTGISYYYGEQSENLCFPTQC